MAIVTKLKWCVRESGSQAKPAILFLYGLPLNGRLWQSQLEDLQEFYCLAPDLLYGRSAGIAPFDMQDTLSRLVELIKASTPNGRALVVGMSLGGSTVYRMRRKTPAYRRGDIRRGCDFALYSE